MGDELRELHYKADGEEAQTPRDAFQQAFEIVMGGPVPLGGEQLVITVWRSTVRVPDEEFSRLHRQIVNRYFGVQAVSVGLPIPRGDAKG